MTLATVEPRANSVLDAPDCGCVDGALWRIGLA